MAIINFESVGITQNSRIKVRRGGGTRVIRGRGHGTGCGNESGTNTVLTEQRGEKGGKGNQGGAFRVFMLGGG